ncbi:hypothetical protein BCV70DRAFT_155586 [Testicularia cyperi]|uniref:Pentacotripeptide-repeat region of PRORP domain-containing protein n=1 Tax=Testicularia cyperi TaxID=1882483 RepID=A0A317XZ04_9BASI|nr:hypothetical protein BCV70DRAFT_155586 [Testicularia cyperi]
MHALRKKYGSTPPRSHGVSKQDVEATIQRPAHARRVDNDKLWFMYRDYAANPRMTPRVRLNVANFLLQGVTLVTANKEDMLQYKLLRYMTAHRLQAILTDLRHFGTGDDHAMRFPDQDCVSDEERDLLQVRSLALEGKIVEASRRFDEALQLYRPNLVSQAHPVELPARVLENLALTLDTILHSYAYEAKCRPSKDTFRSFLSSAKSNRGFFPDPQTLCRMERHGHPPADTEHATRELVAWLFASPHLALFDHERFRTPRVRLFRALSLSDDPIDDLERTVPQGDWHSASVARISDLLLRANMLYNDHDIAASLFEFVVEHGVDISDHLVDRFFLRVNLTRTMPQLESLLDLTIGSHTKDGRRSLNYEKLSAAALRTLARFWAQRGRADRAEPALAEMERRGPSDALRNSVLLLRMELAAFNGDLEKLRQLAQERFDLDAVVQSNCQPGKELMNGRMLRLLLRACNRIDDLETAEQFLDHGLELGLPLEAYHLNPIIDLHVRRSDMDGALAIFEQMHHLGVKPDKYTYTILLHGFAVRRDPEGAAQTLRAMVSAGIHPDRVTYSALLNCYVESGLYQAATSLFNWMQGHPRNRLRPTIEVCNTILKAYVLDSFPIQRVLQFVADVRKQGLEPNANTFALMLQSACDAGLMNIAEELFSELERQLPSSPGHPPGHGANLYHFTIMIHGYLRIGNNDEAKDYFDEMRSRGLQPSAVTWAVMIQSYADGDNDVNYNLARTLVSQLVADESSKAYRQVEWQVPVVRQGLPFEVMYVQLLNAQARRGEPEEAEQTFESLLQTDSGVSLYAMTPLLDAYRRAGQVDQGLNFFERIYENALRVARTKTHRLQTNIRSGSDGTEDQSGATVDTDARRKDITSRNLLCLPLSIMIDMLATAGRHREIAEIWARLRADGFGFDSSNWNHLAASMARAGQLAEALSVVEHVLHHPPPGGRGISPAVNVPRESGRASSQELENEQRPHDDNAAIAAEQHAVAETYVFDPSTMAIDGDQAQNHRSDAVTSPSRPPNRRHQGRVDDDPYYPLPFDRPDTAEHVGDAEAEQGDRDAVPDAVTQRVPRAYTVDSAAGTSLTRHLAQGKDRLSPWYAHFETMEAISQGLLTLRDSGKVMALLDKFPVAAQLLDNHERRVELIREHQRLDAERSARDLIDGRR